MYVFWVGWAEQWTPHANDIHILIPAACKYTGLHKKIENKVANGIKIAK